MKIHRPRSTADAEGGLKGTARMRPFLRGLGGQPSNKQPRYIPRHCLPVLRPSYSNLAISCSQQHIFTD